MDIAAKHPTVLLPSIADVDGTAYVDLLRSNAGNSVDATSSRNVRGLLNRVQCGHSNMSPTQMCCLGIDRVDSTVYADPIDLHYTTTIPQQSSFSAPTLCLHRLVAMPEKHTGGAI
jgi:hypothetical protein